MIQYDMRYDMTCHDLTWQDDDDLSQESYWDIIGSPGEMGFIYLEDMGSIPN